MVRKRFLLGIALAVALVVLASCEKNSPSNPVSNGTSSSGTLVLNVSVAPWRPIFAKSAAIQAMDSVKVFVNNSANSRITEKLLTLNGSRWQGSISVPAQNNIRVVVAYYGASTVRYLGEKTGVNITAGSSTTVDITVNYMGLSVTAPDSAFADYQVKWTSLPFVTGYQLQQDTKADFSTASTIYTGSNTTFTVPIQGKTVGQIYYYRARVNTAYGYGPWYSKGGDSTTSGAQPENGTIIIDVPDLPDELTEVARITLVSIPAGSFSMGSMTGYSDEQPVHTVTLSAFEMSKYEITQGNYKAVMGTNPSYYTGDDNLPVEKVSWWDAIKYCNTLSRNAGLAECYNESTGDCDFSKNGFRLPTEAEWEYACRSGTTTTYNLGDTESDLARAGWYDSNSNSTTHPVGQKTPNAWGLYDMHGNVWEWCNDWYGNYPSGSVINPTGALTDSVRVARGGGYDSTAGCRSAYRGSPTPVLRYTDVGFRVSRHP